MSDHDEQDALGISFRKSKPPQSSTQREHIQTPGRPTVLPFEEDYYKMTHGKRGLAIILNHYEFEDLNLPKREGTNIDCTRICATLSRLRFETTVFQDIKSSRIDEELYKISQLDHSDNDCLVVVVMTHGDPNVLHARDESYSTEVLWEHFTGDKCASLAGKPKLFFIQACRGTNTDEGVECMIEFDSTPSKKPTFVKIPKLADFLMMYATPFGNYSFRSPARGSWFIQALCDELDQKAAQDDLNKILTTVNRRMSYNYASNIPNNRDLHNKKQVGQIISSLTRIVQFN